MPFGERIPEFLVCVGKAHAALREASVLFNRHNDGDRLTTTCQLHVAPSLRFIHQRRKVSARFGNRVSFGHARSVHLYVHVGKGVEPLQGSQLD